MTEADFRIPFEDLMNDYDIQVTRGDSEEQIKTLSKMNKLIAERIKTYEHDKEVYRTKNLENGSD